jgi:hypothetical protein
MKDYTRSDLAKAVAYFTDKLNSDTFEDNTKRIGVAFGNLSFLNLAFMLALQKCQKEFALVYHIDMDFERRREFFSHMYITGAFGDPYYDEGAAKNLGQNRMLSLLNKKHYTVTDTKYHENNALNYHREDDLEIDFSDDRKTYIQVTDRQTEEQKYNLLYPTGKIESSCIAAAIQHYTDAEGTYIFYRPFHHLGVGTLSIYPAVFNASNIILCSYKEHWDLEYQNADHVHVSQSMISQEWPMPPKIKSLTTGGYNFNSDCINYVTARSDVDVIVDCFGTAQLPPPMAIRTLHDPKTNKEWSPFKWINPFVNYKIVNYQMVYSTTDGDIFSELPNTFGGKIVGYDHVTDAGENQFNFHGPLGDIIRMSHIRTEVPEFIKLFKEYSGIGNLQITMEVIDGIKNPVVIVPKGTLNHAILVGKKYHIEAKFKEKE